MDELEALALTVEKGEMKFFYLEMASKAKEERARRMFLFLAGEDAEHWGQFEETFLERAAEECKLPALSEEFLKSEVKTVELGMEQEKLTWGFMRKLPRSLETKK